MSAKMVYTSIHKYVRIYEHDERDQRTGKTSLCTMRDLPDNWRNLDLERLTPANVTVDELVELLNKRNAKTANQTAGFVCYDDLAFEVWQIAGERVTKALLLKLSDAWAPLLVDTFTEPEGFWNEVAWYE